MEWTDEQLRKATQHMAWCEVATSANVMEVALDGVFHEAHLIMASAAASAKAEASSGLYRDRLLIAMGWAVAWKVLEKLYKTEELERMAK